MSRPPGFRFSIQQPSGGTYVEVRIHEDASLSELVEAFRNFARAVGYHESTITEALGEEP